MLAYNSEDGSTIRERTRAIEMEVQWMIKRERPDGRRLDRLRALIRETELPGEEVTVISSNIDLT